MHCSVGLYYLVSQYHAVMCARLFNALASSNRYAIVTTDANPVFKPNPINSSSKPEFFTTFAQQYTFATVNTHTANDTKVCKWFRMSWTP